MHHLAIFCSCRHPSVYPFALRCSRPHGVFVMGLAIVFGVTLYSALVNLHPWMVTSTTCNHSPEERYDPIWLLNNIRLRYWNCLWYSYSFLCQGFSTLAPSSLHELSLAKVYQGSDALSYIHGIKFLLSCKQLRCTAYDWGKYGEGGNWRSLNSDLVSRQSIYLHSHVHSWEWHEVKYFPA